MRREDQLQWQLAQFFEDPLTRRRLLRTTAGGGAALGLGGLLAACGGDSGGGAGTGATAATQSRQATGTPRRGGTLTFARNAEPTSLNPIGPSDNGSIWVQMLIFDQLVEVVPGKADPQPGLAEHWEVSRGGLRYVFELREATFSNGAPVTAEDVKFSLERFANPKVNVGYPFLSSAIDRVRVRDPHTIEIDLKHVSGAFLANISIFVASIVPRKVLEQLGEKHFGTAPIGSGPFALERWTRGTTVELVRNPHYWREGQPYLDGVTFQLIADDNARVLKVRSGEVDVAEAIPYAQVAPLGKVSGLQMLVEPSTAIDAVYLNNRHKPLDEVAVRRALNFATPKQQMLEKTLLGTGEVANSCIPKLKYWDGSVEAIPYDVERAKAALKQSSVASGFALELKVASGDTVEQQKAEILQQQWGAIGVKVQITPVDLGTLFTKWTSGGYEALSFPGNVITSDVTVDDEEAEAQFNIKAGFDSLFTGFDSAEARRLVATATGTLDQDTRQRTFSQLQRYGLEQVPVVPLFFVPYRTAVRDEVQNFRTVLPGWWNLGEVWLER